VHSQNNNDEFKTEAIGPFVMIATWYIITALYPCAVFIIDTLFFIDSDIPLNRIFQLLFPFEGFPYSGSTLYFCYAIMSISLGASLFSKKWITKKSRLTMSVIISGLLVIYESPLSLRLVKSLFELVGKSSSETSYPLEVYIESSFLLLPHILLFVWLLVIMRKTKGSQQLSAGARDS